jgi:predicted DNA-binding transcriptional regulator YafY
VRRTERLFAIAEVLRARRTGITAEALADRFGVAVRTIYRDLDSLRGAALALIGERGRGGGLALDSTYSLPPVNFTAREAAILVAAGRWLERARLIPFYDTLRSAIDKVQGALPVARQREVARLSETLSWIGVPARAPSPEVRAVVEQAWLLQAPMHIEYDGARGPTRRTVRVEAVIMERTMTLLNCHDLDIDEPRQFQLDKIRRAELRSGPPAG